MQITILKTLGPLLAKRISASGVLSYDDAAYFLPKRVEVADLKHFLHILDSIRSDPQKCYIRGTPIPFEQASNFVAKKQGKPDRPGVNGRGAYLRRDEIFSDSPTPLLCIDVDTDQNVTKTDVVTQCINWIKNNLPDDFHDTDFVYQLSSSYGYKPGLRVHLWFWLSTPANSRDVREWAKAWNEQKGSKLLDTAIYSSVQAHYTADPIVDDPLGLFDIPPAQQRTGFVKASNCHVDLKMLTPAGDRAVVDMDAFAALSVKGALEGVTPEMGRQYLQKIQNTGDRDTSLQYDEWLKIGAALHHQFGEEGRELWHEWSSQSELYNAEDLDRRFDSFSESKNSAATFASIIHLAGGRITDSATEDEKFKTWAEKIDNEGSPHSLMKTVLPALACSDVDSILKVLLAERVRQRVKKLTGFSPDKKAVSELLAKAQAAEENRLNAHLEFMLADAILGIHYKSGRHLRNVAGAFWEFISGKWAPMTGNAPLKHRVQAYLRDCLDADKGPSSSAVARLLSGEDRSDRIAALTATIADVIANTVASTENDPLRLCTAINRPVINCLNEEVHLDPKTGEITRKQHDPEAFRTHQLNTCYVPWADCPTWDAAIRRVWKNSPCAEAQIQVFYEYLGYILMINRDYGEYFAIFKGPGGNGKSTLIEIFMFMLGNSALSHSLANTKQKATSAHFEASLVGVLGIFDDDYKSGGILPDDELKRLSGNKILSANPKFGATFNFRCTAMCTILTNSWPAYVDLSEGVRRRALVFEVFHTLSDDEKDPSHRTTILENELPGVLNHLIEGAQRVIRRGRIAPTPEMLAAKSRWLDAGSTLSRFASSMLQREIGALVPANDCFHLYCSFVRYHEDLRFTVGRTTFYESMRQLGFATCVGGRGKITYFADVRVNEEFRTAMKEEIENQFSL